jgi:hypothetical protein
VNHASVPAVLHMAERSLFTRMRTVAAEGDVRVGWKLGHAIAEIDRLGARLPAVGWISTQTVLADGGAYRVRDARALRAETEFAIELKRSVGPDADTNTVCGAIAGLRVALEIVDVARPPHDPRAIVEGNLFHRAVVFGARLGPIAATASAATLGINGSIHEQHEDPMPGLGGPRCRSRTRCVRRSTRPRRPDTQRLRDPHTGLAQRRTSCRHRGARRGSRAA